MLVSRPGSCLGWDVGPRVRPDLKRAHRSALTREVSEQTFLRSSVCVLVSAGSPRSSPERADGSCKAISEAGTRSRPPPGSLHSLSDGSAFLTSDKSLSVIYTPALAGGLPFKDNLACFYSLFLIFFFFCVSVVYTYGRRIGNYRNIIQLEIIFAYNLTPPPPPSHNGYHLHFGIFRLSFFKKYLLYINYIFCILEIILNLKPVYLFLNTFYPNKPLPRY